MPRVRIPQKFRIVGMQPAGPCDYCGGPGGYRWGGREACAIHADAEVRATTLVRRSVQALRYHLEAAGGDWAVVGAPTIKRRADGAETRFAMISERALAELLQAAALVDAPSSALQNALCEAAELLPCGAGTGEG